MAPPILPLHMGGPRPILIQTAPLTPSSFSSFGTAIIPPLPADLNVPPSEATDLRNLRTLEPGSSPILANQGSAIKFTNISAYGDRYIHAPSSATIETPSGLHASPQAPVSQGKPAMNMFSCFPRRKELRLHKLPNQSQAQHVPGGAEESILTFPIQILERHPFTTQTFIPVNTASPASTGTKYLVIVAPSLPNPLPATRTLTASASGKGLSPPQVHAQTYRTVEIQNPPDLANLKAFVAEPGMAVTYGIGTWHAPMVVLGDSRIDFVVVQWMSGVAEEDCEEVLIGSSSSDGGEQGQEGLEVVIGPSLERAGQLQYAWSMMSKL